MYSCKRECLTILYLILWRKMTPRFVHIQLLIPNVKLRSSLFLYLRSAGSSWFRCVVFSASPSVPSQGLVVTPIGSPCLMPLNGEQRHYLSGARGLELSCEFGEEGFSWKDTHPHPSLLWAWHFSSLDKHRKQCNQPRTLGFKSRERPKICSALLSLAVI